MSPKDGKFHKKKTARSGRYSAKISDKVAAFSVSRSESRGATSKGAKGGGAISRKPSTGSILERGTDTGTHPVTRETVTRLESAGAWDSAKIARRLVTD